MPQVLPPPPTVHRRGERAGGGQTQHRAAPRLRQPPWVFLCAGGLLSRWETGGRLMAPVRENAAGYQRCRFLSFWWAFLGAPYTPRGSWPQPWALIVTAASPVGCMYYVGNTHTLTSACILSLPPGPYSLTLASWDLHHRWAGDAKEHSLPHTFCHFCCQEVG